MNSKIIVGPQFRNAEYDSEPRRRGLAQLEQLGELVDEPTDCMTADHADGVVAGMLSNVTVTDGFYEAASGLRILARWGVGYDQVNVAAATRSGVLITVTPVHMDAVAEYTLAQWLATLKRTYELNRLAHSGDSSIIRTYEAQGSTLGLYGCGRIGQEMAMRARPLLGPRGRLLVYDTRPDIAEIAKQFDAEVVDAPETLFEQCDTVCLHVSGDTTVVNYDLLRRMQPHASLINPSRGNLVDDDAVHRAIEEGRFYYYVVDDPANGTRAVHKGHPRVICTNHNGGISVESTIRLDQKCFEQVTDALAGRKPEYILNPEVLSHPRVTEWLGE